MRPQGCATRRCSALQRDAKPKQTPSCSSKSSLPLGREAMTNRPNPATSASNGRNAGSRPMTPSDTLHITAELVASFVSNNHLPAGELPALIQTIHVALTRLRDGVETQALEEQTKAPAVSIRQSITPEYLICLEDGKHFKSLRRHLGRHGLTPEQYRTKWKLPSDYPMV